MKRIFLIVSILAISALGFAERETETELNNIINSFVSNGIQTDISFENLELDVQGLNKINDLDDTETLKNITRNEIISFAKEKLNSRYVWGSTGPSTFDCSGFVGYVFKNTTDINLPRVSSDMAAFKPKIDKKNMKVGDLVFFKTTRKNRISHVGIYMGDNEFIHASSASKKVTISKLDGFYAKTFKWAINPFF